MLKLSVIGPPARLGILTHTFVDPGREVHLRELARLARLAPRSAQQEVDRLVRAGLLLDRRSSNRRYLRANPSHPLFRPIREIVIKTTGLADVLRDALGTDGIEWAIVFGSLAAEEPAAGSDVDLLVVGSLGLREAVRRLGRAQNALGREVNPVVWTRKEFERRRRERDPFLKRVQTGPMIEIVGQSPPLGI